MQKLILITIFLVFCEFKKNLKLISIIIKRFLLGFAFLEYSVNAMSCDSCGSECARACGTRHFRSCCFNYVRKRSSSSSSLPNHINFDKSSIEVMHFKSYEIFKKFSKKLI